MGGTLGGALRLVPSAGGRADFGLELDGSNLILGLAAETEEDRKLLPRYEVSTRLAASGRTVREFAATSRGYLRLVADERGDEFDRGEFLGLRLSEPGFGDIGHAGEPEFRSS